MPEQQPFVWALTICQPWAHLIMQGHKRVENRRWYTGHRGPMLIHAGKSKDWMDLTTMQKYGLDYRDLILGSIVGVADVVDCLALQAAKRPNPKYPWLAKHEHTEGPFCFVLQNVRRFAEPIPYRGEQGLFKVPRSMVQAATQIQVVAA